MALTYQPVESLEHHQQCVLPNLQIGVAGILVLDTKEDGPARQAGIQGTRRDEYGRHGPRA